MPRFKDECAHFSVNKCPIYTHDDASAKLSTNSHETDNSAPTPQLVPVGPTINMLPLRNQYSILV